MCSKPVPGEEVPAWFEEGPQLSYHAAAHHEDFGVANLNQRRTTPIPRWNELKPEIPPENEEEALRLVAGGSYIASRGPDGIVELRRWIEVASGQPWLRRIQVHGAVANNWPEPIKLCLTHPDVGSDVNGPDKDGLTPLHFAAIWGRPNLTVLLLSLGADPTLRDKRSDNTPFDTARQRLSKLLQPKLDSYEGIEEMRTEGQELVDIFQGLSNIGNDYKAWASREVRNRYVQRHSPRLIGHRQRQQLGLLRELVLRQRATVLSAQDVAEAERLAAEEEARLKAEAAGPPKTLEEAMEEAGLLKHGNGSQARSGPKIMMRQMHKFLEVATLEDLKKVTREDIAELDEIDPAERRALWQFVSTHQPVETFAMAMQSKDKTKKTKEGEGAGKKKKKEKSKAASGGGADLSGILAEGIKKGGKSAGKAAGKGGAGAAAAADKASSSSSSSSTATAKDKTAGAAAAAAGTLGESKFEKAEDTSGGYQRHWPDDSSVLKFIFREDLPTDSFSRIAVFLFH